MPMQGQKALFQATDYKVPQGPAPRPVPEAPTSNKQPQRPGRGRLGPQFEQLGMLMPVNRLREMAPNPYDLVTTESEWEPEKHRAVVDANVENPVNHSMIRSMAVHGVRTPVSVYHPGREETVPIQGNDWDYEHKLTGPVLLNGNHRVAAAYNEAQSEDRTVRAGWRSQRPMYRTVGGKRPGQIEVPVRHYDAENGGWHTGLWDGE